MSQVEKTTIDTTVKRERLRLLDFIRRRIRIEDEAEDILQDVFHQFVISYEAIEAIESIERVSAWLFQVARNKIIDRARRGKLNIVDGFQRLDANESSSSMSLVDILPDPKTLKNEPLLQEIIRESIEEALDELPKDQREVFLMHELEDKSFKEIAVVTGLSVNTLLSKKRYAVQHLRDSLSELYESLDID
jgi:RNA polymerase sigma factor (sigma-70 family)